MITRFAPTPSGYLHLGNAVHLRLLTLLAEDRGWRIALRIDDIDSDRTRPEYLADIHDMIEWLAVPIMGEVRTQSQHMDDYAAACAELMTRGAYVCECSRSEWQNHIGPGCPRNCSGLDLVARETSLRMKLGDDDVVVWRREGIPAYHLATIVDDDAMGVTHIVRGKDLQTATAVQRRLAMHLSGLRFTDVKFVHHDLLTDTSGRKLSKSSGIQAHQLPRNWQVREAIERNAARIRRELTTVWS